MTDRSESGILRSACVSPEAATGDFRWSTIQVSVEDGIASLDLDCAPVNVLDMRMMGEISEALTVLGRDATLRALVIGSRLKVFSAGVSVEEHVGDKLRPMLHAFHRLLEGVMRFEAPTVAVIGGAALGGGLELALACDVRVVAAEAKLSVPEVSLGVFPPFAAMRLPELVGRGGAARLVLTGEAIDGTTAHAMGLCDHVAPRADLAAAREAVVRAFRSKSAAALRITKEAMDLERADWGMRFAALEQIYLERLMTTHDAEEGLSAFLEKREPKWKHC